MIALWLAIQAFFSTNTLGGWMDIPPVVPTPIPETTPGAADLADSSR